MSVNRWQVHRAGILNYWYYDEAEFLFAGGRLMLRGSNGSGKSVTMQSLVTVLLDGVTQARRLDSFGSQSRRIEDYLLGEREISEVDERTGYLFFEYKREATEQYVTTGIGLHAKRGTGRVDFWGFVLENGRRVGKDFSLYHLGHDPETGKTVKIPLSRRELVHAIGADGQVVSSHSEYMALVNARVYGFRELGQYEELMRLLIQLRSPKLSRDFKPTVIYEILNASLPALTDEELRPLSKTLANIEQTRLSLEQMRREEKAFSQLCQAYTAYNRSVLGKRASLLLGQRERLQAAERRLEAIGGEQKEAEALCAQAAAALAALGELAADGVFPEHAALAAEATAETADDALAQVFRQRLKAWRAHLRAVRAAFADIGQRREEFARLAQEFSEELRQLDVYKEEKAQAERALGEARQALVAQYYEWKKAYAERLPVEEETKLLGMLADLYETCDWQDVTEVLEAAQTAAQQRLLAQESERLTRACAERRQLTAAAEKLVEAERAYAFLPAEELTPQGIAALAKAQESSDAATLAKRFTRVSNAYQESQSVLTEYRLILQTAETALALPAGLGTAAALAADDAAAAVLFPEDWQALREAAARQLVLTVSGSRKESPYAERDALAQRLAEQQNLLSEQDEALYKQIIMNSIGATISAHIYDAERWVSQMNAIMAQSETSSGLRFHLSWKPDVDAADAAGGENLREVVRLLHADPGALTEEDRGKLMDFFKNRVDQARAIADVDDKSADAWSPAVRDMLDYRQWFAFQLSYDKGEKIRRRQLTDRNFFQFSGGEKAMAMYAPLFSAAYSRYQEAAPDAPRLITLDEAFAGVDKQNMRDMFRLVESMHFNYIMNSQAVWG